MSHLSAWLRRYDIFKNGNYRMKNRDTQAIKLTLDNLEAAALVCNGEVLWMQDQRVVKFQGLTGVEYAYVGEYLVRTIMPGNEYYTSMIDYLFEIDFEKIPATQIRSKKEKKA